MIKTVLPFLFLTLFLSCSSDDTEIVSTSIDYFTEELKDFNGSAQTSYSKDRYDLLDGKYFTRTSFTVGTKSTFQTHYYTNGLLTEEFTNMEAHYTYNGQQLMAMRYNNGGSDQFRRFVAISSTTYYIEVLTAAYDEPSAQITQRFVVEFDANDDVVSIGEDANLDDVVDAVTHFSYQNGDLVAAEEANGTLHNYMIYSDTINNYNAIAEKTYGKKTRRLIFIQEYLDVVANSGLIQSTHLKQSAFENTEYQVLSNHYVKKIYFDFAFGTTHIQSTTLFYFK